MSNQKHYRRYLPHIQPMGATFFVTTHLAGSIPKAVARRFIRERQIATQKMACLNENRIYKAKAQFQHLQFQKTEEILDRAIFGNTWLKNPEIAGIVAEKLHQYNGKYYHLLAFTIMSNHIHVLLDFSAQQLENGDYDEDNYVPLSKVMQYIKGGSAFECNQKLGRQGRFWQREYYDRFVRGEKDFKNYLNYILNNPVKAGLVKSWEDWPFTFLASAD